MGLITKLTLQKWILLFSFTLFSNPGFADNVIKTIEEAKDLYKKGLFSDAQATLEDATTFIQQKRGNQLKKTLPSPLKGWIEKESKLQTVGKKLFGGGLTVFKKYKKGHSEIKISLITDSPMIQSYLGMFSGAFLNNGRGELIRETRNKKGKLKFNSSRKKGDIFSIIDNRYLLKIEGRKIEKNDLLNYFKAIDFKKVKSL